MLGLALGLAMPVAAGVPSDATAAAPAKQALPSEAAKTDGVIVVAGKDKNWNKSKNWNNKHWNNKKVVVVGPLPEVEQAGLLWHRGRWVALGAILGAAAYSAAPPAPNTCWYWADPARTQGYWNYC